MSGELTRLKTALNTWVYENPPVRRFKILNADEMLEVLAIAAKLEVQEAGARSLSSALSLSSAVLNAAPPSTTLDCFAIDRKGSRPSLPPTGAEMRSVRVVSAQPSTDGKHLKVIFAGLTAAESGKANCFDAALWPLITKRVSQSAQLWVMASGNYLNIVGVRE
jgi:hypothetical protein